jgi:CRISPR/Cas system CSM-associated protein Csm3 (group 7 of RAMP superfamily)
MGPLIARLARADGFSLGAHSGAGYGKVRLVDEQITLLSKQATIDNCAPEIEECECELAVCAAEPPNLLELELECEGPFLIADPMRHSEIDEHTDTLTFQRDSGVAELLGSSLMGVMRSRANWLQQTRMGCAPDDHNAK